MTVAKLLIHKYRLCNARINQLIRYVKEHPKALSATFIYAAFVWPLLLVIALTFITLFLSIGISATTLTALFAPSLVIFLQTAVVIWGLSYAALWISRKSLSFIWRRSYRKYLQTDDLVESQENYTSEVQIRVKHPPQSQNGEQVLNVENLGTTPNEI